MEKICIVKRRRIGPQIRPIFGNETETPLWTGSGSHTGIAPNEAVPSCVEAASRIESITQIPLDKRTSPQVFSLQLTPEQIDRIRKNSRFQRLYGPSDGPVYLNVHLESAFSVRMLKSSQICDMLQISRSTLARLVRTGSIKVHRIGRLRRFATEDVMEFLSSQMTVGSLRTVRNRGFRAGFQLK